eukprot:gene16750-22913_t
MSTDNIDNELMNQVQVIIALRDNKEQGNRFIAVIDTLMSNLSSSTNSCLKHIAAKLLSEEVHQQVTKVVLLHLCRSIVSKLNSDESMLDSALFLVSSIKQNSSSYEDADCILREALFTYYISCELFSDAAQILSGLNLDSSVKVYSDSEKADIYVKCSEAYLEDDQPIDAEIFVIKASPLINSVTDWTLLLRYRVTYARILDANRKFVEAADRYYDLSLTTNSNIVQEDLLELLGKAVTCVILGKSGPQRTRLLTLIYNDERLYNLNQLSNYSSHATSLSKMYEEQILKKSEFSLFEATLLPHQKA